MPAAPHPAAAAAADLPTLARSLPKVLLHEHLDGNLRVGTLFELLRARGIAGPAAGASGPAGVEEPAGVAGLTGPSGDSASLAAWFAANAHAGSLEKYLQGFALTVAAMASPAALRRVAREAAEDAASQGVVLAEFRIAPLLFEAHGLDGDTVVDALLQGLADSPLPLGTHSALIVCAMRQLPLAQTERAAALALRWRARGVVGFDLAGPEAGFPATEHQPALQRLRDAGLALTLHAGEADVAWRVLEAGRLGARRIGHGVRLADTLQAATAGDAQAGAWLEEVRAGGLHLEVCPTSNVHTGAAVSVAAHPITALWRAGISLSYHTDNTLMSCLSHGDEALALLTETPLNATDLGEMAVHAARHSFLDAPARERAEAAVRQGCAALGVPLAD